MAEYYNVTTNLGDAEIANAIAANTKLNITHIAFGDGNGSVPTPNKARTSLVREVHRQAVTKYERHATNANWIVIETIIPSDVGGFTIREMGIIANGKLISHGSHAPFEKVADPSGVSEYRLRFTQNVTDGSVVELTLDESLIYATQAWIDENYIKRSEIVDNLTTNDANKVASARTVKELQDNKLEANDLKDASTTQKGIVQLVNDLTTGGTQIVVTAEAIKSFYQMFSGGSSRFRIPNPLEPDKPWIIQFFNTPFSAANIETNFIQNFPVAFPNECKFVLASDYQNAFVNINTLGLVLSTYGKTKTGVGIIWDAIASSSYPTSRSASILAIGN